MVCLLSRLSDPYLDFLRQESLGPQKLTSYLGWLVIGPHDLPASGILGTYHGGGVFTVGLGD